MAASKKPRVFDVSKPGQGHAAASSSSKPILVTNRPVMRDSMVHETPTEALSAPPVPSAHKMVIKPLDDQFTDKPAEPVVPEPGGAPVGLETPEAPTPDTEESKTIEVKVAKKLVITPPVHDNEPAAPAEPVKAAEPIPVITNAKGEAVTKLEPELPPGVPGTTRDDKQLSSQQAEDALKLAQERAARLEHMIEKEQYFLPINAVEERHNRRVAVLGLLLVILLAVAWYDSALDANLIPNTYNLPHTSFFTVH